MNDIAELIEAKIDVMLTNIIANKLDFLDKDNQFSPLICLLYTSDAADDHRLV